MLDDKKENGKFSTSARKSRLNNSMNTMGKIPPQAIDVEEAVLGALMLERNAIYDVIDLLRPEMFYQEAHKNIYSAIVSLYANRNPIDILSVTSQLRKDGNLENIGGPFYVTNLTNRVASAANIEFHCRIIMQKYLQRELIRNSTEVISDCYDDTTDVFDVLGSLSNFVSNAEVGFIGSNESEIKDVVNETIIARQNAPKNDDTIHGLESGVTEFDKLIDGFGPGELDVVAARPAMGKTAVICAIADNISIPKETGDTNIKPIALFSLEMSKRQILQRIESKKSGINGNKIKRNDLTEEEAFELMRADHLIADGKLVIDDQSFINIDQVISRIKMYYRKYGIKGVIIDYLQLISAALGKGGNRESEISNMTRSLKVCAGELGIPVIILAQLSREVEKRKPLCLPVLSDLRESGAIEQDADKVVFLWRPEYYGVLEPTFFRLFNKSIDNKNLLVFIVAKHREGELGNVPALFTPWNMRVTNHPDLETQFQLPINTDNSFTPSKFSNPSNNDFNPDPNEHNKEAPF